MKVQKILWTQAIVIGLAAALFLASSAPAQEITNTEWPDQAGASEPLQTASAPVASTANTVAANQATDSRATASDAVATQEAAVTQLPVRGLSITFLLLSIAGIALYARAEAKGTDRKLDARLAHVGRSVSLS
jgi:hypothetical protein